MDEHASLQLVLATLEKGARGRAATRASTEEFVDDLGAGVWRLSVDRYQSTLLVADDHCILIDTQDNSRSSRIWKLVRSVTDLPLRALLYSHHHLDHIGGAEQLLEQADCTADFEVICTEECGRAIKRHSNRVPAPTKLLTDDDGELIIGTRVIRHGSARGHCSDNTWFIVPDAKVLHCVDVLHPGTLEFEGFGIAADVVEYEATLNRLLELEWSVIVAGHGELGTPDDVRSALRYLADIRAAIHEVNAQLDSAAQAMGVTGRRDIVVASSVERLRPAWGDRVNFEADSWSHVNAVYWAYYMFLDASHSGAH